MSKNPSMKKSTAFAVATQQAEAQGKDPAGYGTAEGHREAKKKYDKSPSQYESRADPGGIGKSASLTLSGIRGFADEVEKIAKADEQDTKHSAGKRGALRGVLPGAVTGAVIGGAGMPGYRLGKSLSSMGQHRGWPAGNALKAMLHNHPQLVRKALKRIAVKGAVGGLATGAALGAGKGYLHGRELHHIVRGNREQGKKKQSASSLGPTAPATVGTVTKALPRLSPSLKQPSYSKPVLGSHAANQMSTSLPPPLATMAGAI